MDRSSTRKFLKILGQIGIALGVIGIVLVLRLDLIFTVLLILTVLTAYQAYGIQKRPELITRKLLRILSLIGIPLSVLGISLLLRLGDIFTLFLTALAAYQAYRIEKGPELRSQETQLGVSSKGLGKARVILALALTILGTALLGVAILSDFYPPLMYPQAPIELTGLSLMSGAFVLVAGVYLFLGFLSRTVGVFSCLLTGYGVWSVMLVIIIAMKCNSNANFCDGTGGGAIGEIVVPGLFALVIGLFLLFKHSGRTRPLRSLRPS